MPGYYNAKENHKKRIMILKETNKKSIKIITLFAIHVLKLMRGGMWGEEEWEEREREIEIYIERYRGGYRERDRDRDGYKYKYRYIIL